MYDYGYDYGYVDYDSTASVLGGLAAMMGLISLIGFVVSILMIISLWKIFKKAGKNGWESLIPIYNFIVLIQIVELPMWYIALFFVPFANIYAMFKIYIELAHKFGKSTGFGILTVFFSFVCLPILAFGKNNVYNGRNNSTMNVNNNMQPTQYTQNNTNAFQNQPTPMNNINSNNFNNQPQQPFMFNQNINTEINPIPANPNNEPLVNNQMNQFNSVQQPNQFGQATPTVNPQPEVATQTFQMPTTANTAPNDMQQPVNGMMNQQQAILNQNNNNNPFNQNM